jgi:hypothetical protein
LAKVELRPYTHKWDAAFQSLQTLATSLIIGQVPLLSKPQNLLMPLTGG